MPWPAWNAPLKRFESGVKRPMNRSSTVLPMVGRHTLSREARIHAAAVGA